MTWYKVPYDLLISMSKQGWQGTQARPQISFIGSLRMQRWPSEVTWHRTRTRPWNFLLASLSIPLPKVVLTLMKKLKYVKDVVFLI